jgi:hypothetical protein
MGVGERQFDEGTGRSLEKIAGHSFHDRRWPVPGKRIGSIVVIASTGCEACCGKYFFGIFLIHKGIPMR